MISFKDLNENINEYNLIKKIIDYSGKQNTLYDKYERLLIKYDCDLYCERIYKKNILSLDFIREFQNKLNWYKITIKLKIWKFNTIIFIREFKDKLDWSVISWNLMNYNLNTIDFIREFKNKIEWNSSYEQIDCMTYNLKEYNLNTIEFIREFKDKLNWVTITKELKENNLNTIDFIKEFENELKWKYIEYDELLYKNFNIFNIQNRIMIKLRYENNIIEPDYYSSEDEN
jgi:hypothetical protein